MKKNKNEKKIKRKSRKKEEKAGWGVWGGDWLERLLWGSERRRE
jgi:hypothetical protein